MQHTSIQPAARVMGKLEIKRRGLNLFLGESIGENAVSSSRLAYELAASDEWGRVLFINTFQGRWKIDATFAESIGSWFTENTQESMSIYSSTIGELSNEREQLAPRMFSRAKAVDTIVVNSWEFAAKDSRSRERLLYLLQEWVTVRGFTVIVFAESLPKQARKGKIMRGGFGKLVAAVDEVVAVEPAMLQQIRADAAVSVATLPEADDVNANEVRSVVEAPTETYELEAVLNKYNITTTATIGASVHNDVVQMQPLSETPGGSAPIRPIRVPFSDMAEVNDAL